MRKVALLAAFGLSVAFLSISSTVPASAQAVQDLNKNTHLFLKDLFNPAAAAPAPAKGGKKVAAKKGKKKKKA
jgi:hypothetical protein